MFPRNDVDEIPNPWTTMNLTQQSILCYQKYTASLPGWFKVYWQTSNQWQQVTCGENSQICWLFLAFSCNQTRHKYNRYIQKALTPCNVQLWVLSPCIHTNTPLEESLTYHNFHYNIASNSVNHLLNSTA